MSNFLKNYKSFFNVLTLNLIILKVASSFKGYILNKNI